MQFNSGGDSLSYKDLQQGTKISDETLRPTLVILVKLKVLEHNTAADTYDINLGFKHPKVRRSVLPEVGAGADVGAQIRINLNQPIKQEKQQETNEVMKAVDEDRKLLIQVRCDHSG
jgi:cullin 1